MLLLGTTLLGTVAGLTDTLCKLSAMELLTFGGGGAAVDVGDGEAEGPFCFFALAVNGGAPAIEGEEEAEDACDGGGELWLTDVESLLSRSPGKDGSLTLPCESVFCMSSRLLMPCI